MRVPGLRPSHQFTPRPLLFRYEYLAADETAMLAMFAAKETEMAAIPEILGASFVQTAAGSVITPASCGADIPEVVAASCTGTATDACAVPDCSSLATTGTACADAGCTLIPTSDLIACSAETEEANCPTGCTFAAAVEATNPAGTIVARYADKAAADAVATTVATMLGDLAQYMVADTMVRALGPVMWETDTETLPAGFYALTTIEYADELELLEFMDDQKDDLLAIAGITFIKAVKIGELEATIVGGYTDAAAAAAAATEVSEALANLGPYVTAAPARVTGSVTWSVEDKLQGFFAVTAFEYAMADEVDFLATMASKETEMAAIDEILSARLVKTGAGVAAGDAADEITCSATTPDATGANCPTDCTYAASVPASCGGTADDACTTPDCSALAADSTCTDATGCVLTPLEPASCGDDIPEVVAANAHGTLVGAYVSAAAATAASAEVAPLLGEISSTYMVAGTMQRYTGPVIWETTWTLGPGDFYAITMMTYADEAAMMDEMDANVLELGSVPGLNSVKAVKVAEATTAANEITCSATTPDAATCGGTADDGTTTPDCSALAADTTCTAATGCTLTAAGANCPTGCTYDAAVHASCGGTADDGTTDCSALATTGTTCADATGCVLTPLEPASCGADIPEVIESDGTVILIAAYEDAAAAVAASATISEMLGSLSLHAAPPTAPNRMTGSVIWEQPGEEEAFPPLCAAPDYARPVPPEDAESAKVSSAAGVTVASGVLMSAVSLALF
jgi:hypothetical protein